MEIGVGDWVKVDIQPSMDFSGSINENGSAESYDPATIGDMVLKTTSGITYSPDELRILIRTYDSDQEHIESILQYVSKRKV